MLGRRIFIAVDISEEARAAVAKYIHALRSQFANVRLGWERPEKLHFTLKFLGHVHEASLPAVEGAVQDIIRDHEPFGADVLGTGVFPNAREPRVLWLGMGKGKADMIALGTSIERAVEQLGFKADPRPYSPHLTIGRVREPRNGRELAATHVKADFGPIEFNVRDVTIYESTLGPSGSTYDVVSRHPLAK